MLNRTHLFDLDFISDADFNATIAEIMTFDIIQDQYRDRLPFLITPNVDDIVKFDKKENLPIKNKMQRAAFILPDGQFVVWSGKLIGKPLLKRLPGSDLFPALWKTIIKSQKKILLIAPDEMVAKKLQQEYNNLIFIVPPFFNETDITTVKNIVEEINIALQNFRPDLVFIGIRFPKQHLIAIQLQEHLEMYNAATSDKIKPPLFLLLGASFEFYLGLKKRAPKYMQIIGMEWFYRFLQEPKRLFKRFFIEDLAFFPIVYREWKKNKK